MAELAARVRAADIPSWLYRSLQLPIPAVTADDLASMTDEQIALQQAGIHRGIVAHGLRGGQLYVQCEWQRTWHHAGTMLDGEATAGNRLALQIYADDQPELDRLSQGTDLMAMAQDQMPSKQKGRRMGAAAGGRAAGAAAAAAAGGSAAAAAAAAAADGTAAARIRTRNQAVAAAAQAPLPDGGEGDPQSLED